MKARERNGYTTFREFLLSVCQFETSEKKQDDRREGLE
jgi:hypothetical protein